ncbi:MAG: hypothetical protein QXW62_05865 [Candidatus Methanomethylicaceae archaeon]|nr:hypothetical protein [Candidatus Verstraetearchaeota archaeon]
MDRKSLYLISLILFITIATSSLAALGENRIDVYLSIFIIIYFTLTSIFRPRKRTFDFLAMALLAIFFYIVAIKIMEILIKP